MFSAFRNRNSSTAARVLIPPDPSTTPMFGLPPLFTCCCNLPCPSRDAHCNTRHGKPPQSTANGRVHPRSGGGRRTGADRVAAEGQRLRRQGALARFFCRPARITCPGKRDVLDADSGSVKHSVLTAAVPGTARVRPPMRSLRGGNRHCRSGGPERSEAITWKLADCCCTTPFVGKASSDEIECCVEMLECLFFLAPTN